MNKTRIWRIFFINISLIVIIFLTGIFMGFILRTNQIIRDQVTITARAHFKNIVLSRRWNARYGGVYVEKTYGVQSNPFLENPDISTIDGKVYTKKNPALMTREISALAEETNDFKYHITSLKPLNPNNTPNEFEKAALLSFEQGKLESFDTILQGGNTMFRYMAPLYVEASCLQCHAMQGYTEGQVRGGISVQFDISQIETEIRSNAIYILTLVALISLLMLGTIWYLVSRLANRLSKAYEIIENMSVTDELTSLYNRRYIQTRLDEELSRTWRHGSPLSLMILDIDNFKRVNDNFGHQTGDMVLRQFSALLQTNVRKADVAARWGGEEFVVILTESNVSQAKMAAEKVRSTVESTPFEIEGDKSIPITISIGVSSINMVEKNAENSAEKLIKIADDALYVAKQKGRNRTIVGESDARHP